MESEWDRQSEARRAPVQPVAAQGVAIQPEEREARWRLELAETRTHPFQSAKVCFCLAEPPVSPKECAALSHLGSVQFRFAAMK
jgi:hypothetical protein